MFVLSSIVLSLSLGGPAPAQPAPAKPAAMVLEGSLKVGGDGAWDYLSVDSQAGRLFVPRSTRMMVMDLQGKPLGEIANTAGVHGDALAPELDRGYTSNGRANTMTVFKLSTLEVLQEVKTTGENPDAISYDPATRQVFTFNGCGRNATVFDAVSLEVKGTIAMGGKPEFAAVDGKGRLFVNVEDRSEVLAVNTRTLKVEVRWSVKPVEEPTGLALDGVGQRLFVVGGAGYRA